jgi:hypothetical protein
MFGFFLHQSVLFNELLHFLIVGDSTLNHHSLKILNLLLDQILVIFDILYLIF